MPRTIARVVALALISLLPPSTASAVSRTHDNPVVATTSFAAKTKKKPVAKKKPAAKTPAACVATTPKKAPVKKKPVKKKGKRQAVSALGTSAGRYAVKKTSGKKKPGKKKPKHAVACPKPATPSIPKAPVAPAGTPTPPAPPTVTPAPSSADATAQSLIDAVTSATSTADAMAATTRLLRSAGIGLYGDATPSPDGLQLTPEMVRSIGQDTAARASGGRMSLLELAGLLGPAGFGDPTTDPGLEGYSSTDDVVAMRLEHMLSDWLAIAEANPAGPDAEPILLLARLALSQHPAIDLSQPGYDPDDLELGDLDLTLIIGGIARLAPVFRGGLVAPQRLVEASPRDTQNTPCSDLKTVLENAVPLAGSTWGYTVGQLGDAALSAYAGLVSTAVGAGDQATGAARFNAALSAVSLLAKAQALVELYQVSTAQITSPPGTLDRPGPTEPDEATVVTVRAGVDDATWADFGQTQGALDTQGFLDCMNLFGMPTPTLSRDIGSSVGTWKAGWSLGGSDGAQISLAGNHFDFSPLKKLLSPIDDHSGASTLTVDAVHGARNRASGDKLVHSTAVVKAAVQTDTPPNFSTFLNAANVTDAFGLPNAVADILLRMFQAADTFDAQTTIDVVKHEPADAQWTGTAKLTRRFSHSEHTSGHPSGVVVGLSTHSEDTSSLLTSEADVLGVSSDGGGSEEHDWSVSARGLTTYAATSHGQTFDKDTSAGAGCNQTDEGMIESHGSITAAPQTLPVTIVVHRDGTWEASGLFADYDYDTTVTGHLISFGPADRCPNNDHGVQTATSSSHNSGESWSATGQFDPSNPPSTLHAQVDAPPSFGTTTRLTVNLDYHAPIPTSAN